MSPSLFRSICHSAGNFCGLACAWDSGLFLDGISKGEGIEPCC